VIILEVEDANAALVQGATVSSQPAAGKVAYSDANGTPTSTTSTAADGRAFLFNLPPGTVTVSASKTGTTFSSHPVGTFADSVTTTIVEP
jgi:hypothetical protein